MTSPFRSAAVVIFSLVIALLSSQAAVADGGDGGDDFVHTQANLDRSRVVT